MANWVLTAITVALIAALVVMVKRDIDRYGRVLYRQVRLYRAMCALALFIDSHVPGPLPDDVRSLIDSGWDGDDRHS